MEPPMIIAIIALSVALVALIVLYIRTKNKIASLTSRIDSSVKDLVAAQLETALHYEHGLELKSDILNKNNAIQDMSGLLSAATTRAAQATESATILAQVELANWKKTEEKRIRADALTRSRNTIRGQVTEHLAPFMIEGFSYKDFRFVGGTIDFIVFDNLNDYNDEDEIFIYLMDIKTGQARLSKKQRLVKKAIEAGRFGFIVVNTDKKTTKVTLCQTKEKTIADNDLES